MKGFKNSIFAALILLLITASGRVDAQQRATVDFRADRMTSLRVGDSTALCLVGNVVFYHNGAVICCDSAVRYSDRMMDCYKHVVVNKDSTFIYGDRADYNGLINEARVYAPLIKMVDKDAVLYTRNFTFNTLTNIGRYYGGGTLRQKDNRMESDEGFYYAKPRELLALRNVQMQNPTYRMRSDSVFYNMDTEIARFRTLSYVWNDRNEFLTARHGEYESKEKRYTFTDSSYIMTPTREAWADTIVYHEPTQDALMLNNVQVTDDEQRVMAFGDYARYWGNEQRAVLARNPVVAGYERGGDTLYMRSDSMFLYTIDHMKKDSTAAKADSSLKMPFDGNTKVPQPMPAAASDGGGVLPTATASTASGERSGGAPAPNSARPAPSADPTRQPMPEGRPAGTAAQRPGGRMPAVSDSTLQPPADSTTADSTALDSTKLDSTKLTPKMIQKREADRLRAEKKAVEKAKRDKRIAVIEEKIKARRAKEATIAMKLRKQDWARQRNEIARRYLRGKATPDDSLALVRLDSLEGVARDSVAKAADSTAKANQGETALTPPADSVKVSPPAHDSTRMAADSIEQIVRGYRNVRIFRKDIQAVCDSLVGFSADSTLHLYIKPVLWNEQNQVTSDVVDLFTRNKTLERALFKGDPLMISQMQLDTSCYNQLKGKTIEALFRDGELYRMNAVGNAQTYYYSTDDSDSTDVYINGFLVAESGEVSFYFEKKELLDITYRIKPVCTIFPMEKIPEDQPRRLKGFTWQADRRPQLKDVFTRTIRPSERERYAHVPQPGYPITKQIDEQRKQLTSIGWVDRTDRYLSQEAVEFVQSILRNPKSMPTATPIPPEPAANAATGGSAQKTAPKGSPAKALSNSASTAAQAAQAAQVAAKSAARAAAKSAAKLTVSPAVKPSAVKPGQR